MCFDDDGRLYVAGVEGVARFCHNPAADTWDFDGFLCTSVHAEGMAEGMVVLPDAANDVAFCGGTFVVSAMVPCGKGTYNVGLWVLDQAGGLVRHMNAKECDHLLVPNYLAMRMFD